MTLGAESVLERLFEAEAKRILRALVAYTGDQEVASDAMAEAFAQALARGEKVRSPRRWVWRAAFRIAAGELKARGRDRYLMEDPGYDMPEPPRDLIAALAKLSPRQRAALILHYYGGYSTREVGPLLLHRIPSTAAFDSPAAAVEAGPEEWIALQGVLLVRAGAPALLCATFEDGSCTSSARVEGINSGAWLDFLHRSQITLENGWIARVEGDYITRLTRAVVE